MAASNLLGTRWEMKSMTGVIYQVIGVVIGGNITLKEEKSGAKIKLTPRQLSENYREIM